MKLAIANARSKRLAAGTVSYADSLKIWYLTLYGVTNGTAHPFGASPFEDADAAIAEGNDVLKVADDDWIEIDDCDVATYIEINTRNNWDVH